MSLYISKTAKYYDGKTGHSRTVSLVLTGSSLQLKDGEDIIETWSINQLTVLDHPAPPVPGIFGNAKNKDARLYVEDAKDWKKLYERLPKHARKKLVLPNNWSSFAIYILVAVISVIFLFKMFPRIIENTAYLIPLEIERSIGRQAVHSIVGTDNVCIAPKGHEALLKVFGKLEAQTKREIDYEILVIDNSWMLNAFAAPGGYLIIYREIIERADTPEEVIGVLAHEISHVDLYHTTKGLVRDIGMRFVLSMMVGGTSVEDLAGFFSQMNYSREDESEADMHGRELMVKAGINPKGMRNFFENLQEWEGALFNKVEDKIKEKTEDKSENSGLSDFLDMPLWEYLSTHPDTDKRIERLKELEDGTKYAPALTAQEWQDLRNICDVTKTLKL